MKKLIVTLLSFFALSAQAKVINLTLDNSVRLNGEVSFESVAKWQYALQTVVEKRAGKSYPIYLVIDSPGGSIEAGFSFLEYAKHVPNVHTITIFGASMASAIAMQIPGKRYVTESGIFMFHRAYARVSGQVEDGELESQLELVKKRVKRLEKASAKRIGLTLPAYKAKVLNEWWLDSDDSIEQKVADEIIGVTCSKELVKTTVIQIFRSFFGVMEEKTSACPLIR
jgi:ATP-dependent protease ClpP protease subunit